MINKMENTEIKTIKFFLNEFDLMSQMVPTLTFKFSKWGNIYLVRIIGIHANTFYSSYCNELFTIQEKFTKEFLYDLRYSTEIKPESLNNLLSNEIELKVLTNSPDNSETNYKTYYNRIIDGIDKFVELLTSVGHDSSLAKIDSEIKRKQESIRYLEDNENVFERGGRIESTMKKHPLKLSDIQIKLKKKISENLTYNMFDLVKDDYYIFDFNVKLSTGDYLQRGFEWTIEQKESFILSIIKDIPIGNFAFVQKRVKVKTGYNTVVDKSVISVIDGKQRLSTVISFIKNEFPIKIGGSQYFYSELPSDIYLYLKRFEIKTDIMYDYENDSVADKDKIDWFKRLNWFGTKHEIEHINAIERNYESSIEIVEKHLILEDMELRLKDKLTENITNEFKYGSYRSNAYFMSVEAVNNRMATVLAIVGETIVGVYGTDKQELVDSLKINLIPTTGVDETVESFMITSEKSKLDIRFNLTYMNVIVNNSSDLQIVVNKIEYKKFI